MRLPRAEHAVIDSRKVREYILSRTHPIGRFKAAYFASLGYTSENWREVEAALRQAAVEGQAEAQEQTEFGQKYRVRSKLTGPTGRSAVIVSIWIVRHGETAPRFVTVMPEKQPR